MADYRFLKAEKDPVIDLIRTVAQDELGELNGDKLAELSYQSGISVTTLRNWFFGETRYPQHLNVRMVLQALNCKLRIVREDGTEVRGPRHGTASNGKGTHKLPASAQGAAGRA